MRILERKDGWFIEQICTGKGNGDGGCTSRLAVEKEDIYVTSSSDYIGDIDYYYTFRCPVCGVETDIKNSDIPYSIKRESLERYKAKRLSR
jgi:hypothetical protein